MKTTDYIDEIVPCLQVIEHEQTPGERIDKVRQIQRELESGKYNLDERLDIAMDRLIEEILMQNPENQVKIFNF